MLEYLHIENIAVAKDIDIEFSGGFNVLTGETGAGKSVIIDSINMILGAKVSKEIIRHGESFAVASVLFSEVNDSVYALCDELGIPYDKEDMFSISRTFTKEGKNIIKRSLLLLLLNIIRFSCVIAALGHHDYSE